ncbi:MAG: hypothetical protein KAH05_07450, partial [Clostridiales bacterium]|nr:hypothetical protein [Clostridiales bacterium]
KNKWNILLMVMIVLLLYQNYGMNNKLSSMRNDIWNVNNEINRLSGNIGRIETVVRDMKKADDYIKNFSYEVENINGLYEKANVDVVAEFNRIGNDDKVILMYSIRESGDWNNVELQKSDASIYSAGFEGDYEYDYDMKVVIIHEDTEYLEDVASVKLHTGSLPQFFPHVWMRNIVDKEMKYSLSFENLASEFESRVAVTNVKVETFYKGDLIESVENMMDDQYMQIQNEEINRYEINCSIKIDESDLSEDDIKIVMTVTDEIGRVFVREFSSENDFTGEKEIH